ncbi:microfibril-associated glycoprotein 4-like [Clytia hemisphaerica]|uniref:microfibril-associated glycoprotein 4-like n=1 Tax=Clytia hemisphaerica TaxID=252671 RepID=UPI0034D4C296
MKVFRKCFLLALLPIFLKTCEAENLFGCDTKQRENGHFIKVEENVTIEGIQPFAQNDVGSHIECTLSCQQQGCYITQIAINGTRLVCLLFHYISDIASRLKPLIGSDVFQIDLQVKSECRDWLQLGYNKDGLYWIGIERFPIKQVFCDMTTYGGGWIVMQKRFDGSVDFYQEWQQYKCGFGNAVEHWLGLEFVHQFTSAYTTEILLYGERFDGSVNTALFGNFSLGGEDTNYKLNTGNLITGAHEQDWLHHDGMAFSTRLEDNDACAECNCAEGAKSAWWYRACFLIDFNNHYSSQPDVIKWKGVHWESWSGALESLKATKMLIRGT